MEIKNYKEYATLIISMIMFLFIVVYILLIFLNWTPQKPVKDNYSVEVTLPIMDWQKYSNLSKQYKADNIN